MQLTIHRGTHEIGGNCIEVSTDAARIVLDIGMPLVDANRDPFDSLSLRNKSIEQLLADGTLPNIPGLFQEGHQAPNAIFLSHAHIDHVGLLKYARPEIPVYCSRGTSKMMMAASIFAGQPQLARERQVTLTSGRPVMIGNLRITPFAVDHSTHGCLAMLIEADGKRLLYSGDLRMHGRNAAVIQPLLDECKRKPIDLLLMEGTHLGSSRERGLTEQELEEEILRAVQETYRLVLACFSPCFDDRLLTFYHASRRAGRTFVVDIYGAFVLHLLRDRPEIPQVASSEGIRVFYYQGFLDKHARQPGLYQKIYDSFLEHRISLDEILQSPERHLMLFRPSMIDMDFDGSLPANVRCLYSLWQGYLDRPDGVAFREKLLAAGGELMPLHTSGHIFPADLRDLVETIKPRKLAPIHTFEPKLFNNYVTNVVFLKDKAPYTL